VAAVEHDDPVTVAIIPIVRAGVLYCCSTFSRRLRRVRVQYTVPTCRKSGPGDRSAGGEAMSGEEGRCAVRSSPFELR
jgi:hypothetical protein